MLPYYAKFNGGEEQLVKTDDVQSAVLRRFDADPTLTEIVIRRAGIQGRHGSRYVRTDAGIMWYAWGRKNGWVAVQIVTPIIRDPKSEGLPEKDDPLHQIYSETESKPESKSEPKDIGPTKAEMVKEILRIHPELSASDFQSFSKSEVHTMWMKATYRAD